MEKVENLYYFVGTDPVGLEDLMAVERALLRRNPPGKVGRQNGLKAVWFTDDITDSVSKKLERKGITSFSRNPSDGDVPSGIVITVSLLGTPLLLKWSEYARRNKVPLYWLESSHGVSVHPTLRHVPAGIICVFDDVAAQAVRQHRPNTTVLACGKPSLRQSGVFAEDRDDVRNRVRKLWGVQDTERLGCVLLEAVREKELEPYMRALVQMERVPDIRWSVRLSPRLSPDTSKRYHKFMQRTGLRLTVFDQSYPLDLAHAVDVAVADGNHELAYITAALGTPTVVYLPESKNEDPPHVAANAVCVVRGSPANVPGAVCEVLDPAYSAPDKKSLRDLLAPDAANRVVRSLLADQAQKKGERAA